MAHLTELASYRGTPVVAPFAVAAAGAQPIASTPATKVKAECSKVLDVIAAAGIDNYPTSGNLRRDTMPHGAVPLRANWGTVSGSVVSAESAPLARRTVRLYRRDGLLVGEAVSAVDGSVSIPTPFPAQEHLAIALPNAGQDTSNAKVFDKITPV